MNRDKQIEEMTKVIARRSKAFRNPNIAFMTTAEKTAESLYNADYRKASDVAKEIADFIWEKDIADTMLPINGRYLSKQDFIAELKKKYESEDK